MNKVILMVLLMVCLTGCDYINNTINAIDTSKIRAFPSNVEAGIKFGGDYTTIATAEIKSVMFECIPTDITISDKASTKAYTIALTSNVSYSLQNKYMSPLYADVVFEAKSKQGVIIGSTIGRAKLIDGSTQTMVSAKMLGLSPGELKKIEYITARWDYGK